ncbi:hypothetical protein BO82DRAFT_67388 [Aspergillus uvarum CBS 121591]|uniref:Uncharacterized protein n=1 Tax=Aspergillus uvarum CBS 121591 TaxID=1448315 RepID=A0A319DSB9_9EURO|nr:hypothetical protein BO82DRAFT_67388 [Aspergillus uvarum CBS 121591]PYH82092.1 hypothetical protein BO82DRAFT_67388 [Aspergillus uvarum CBS 121591]
MTSLSKLRGFPSPKPNQSTLAFRGTVHPGFRATRELKLGGGGYYHHDNDHAHVHKGHSGNNGKKDERQKESQGCIVGRGLGPSINHALEWWSGGVMCALIPPLACAAPVPSATSSARVWRFSRMSIRGRSYGEGGRPLVCRLSQRAAPGGVGRELRITTSDACGFTPDAVAILLSIEGERGFWTHGWVPVPHLRVGVQRVRTDE